MTIEQMAREYTEDALQRIVGLMGSDNDKLAMEAATQLLDRAHGAVVNRMLMATVGDNQASPQTMTMDQLLQAAQSVVTNNVTEALEAPIDGDCTRIVNPDEGQDSE